MVASDICTCDEVRKHDITETWFSGLSVSERFARRRIIKEHRIFHVNLRSVRAWWVRKGINNIFAYLES